jgi:RNA polymerase nonessential primary-like sigma factor
MTNNLTNRNKQLLEEFAATQSQEVKQQLVINNQLLAWKVAQKHGQFAAQGMDIEDLFHEGITGLMTALERFDVHRGHALSTYSMWWIERNVRRAKLEQGEMIRYPENFVTLLNKVRRCEVEYEQLETPTISRSSYVCFTVGISAKAYADLTRIDTICGQVGSLHDMKPGDDDLREIGEDVSYHQQAHMTFHREFQDAADLVCENDTRALLNKALMDLTDEERNLIALHFGLVDGQSVAVSELARTQGVSKTKMQKKKEDVLQKLRLKFAEWNITFNDVA